MASPRLLVVYDTQLKAVYLSAHPEEDPLSPPTPLTPKQAEWLARPVNLQEGIQAARDADSNPTHLVARYADGTWSQRTKLRGSLPNPTHVENT